MTNTDFAEWLDEKIKEKGMKPVELARLANLDPGVITRVLKADRTASPKTLESIARALKLPREAVFRAAGLLPPVSEIDALREEIIEMTERMSREEQREVLNYIRWRESLTKESAQETTPKGKLATNPAK